MIRTRSLRRWSAVGAGCLAVVVLAACGSSGGSGGTSASTDTTSSSTSMSSGPSSTTSSDSTSSGGIPAKYDLKAAGCPSTVTIQTDWNPESEHGGQYELVGPGYTVNTDQKSVTGPLYASGHPTGVNVSIRSGGPAIGYQTVTSQLYKDKSITLGYLGTDEQVSLSKTLPTVAVLAGLEKSPQIIMWSPQQHPDWKTIADIGKTTEKVLYFQGAAYMDYLTGQGILQKSQIDGSYDGTPTEFVGSGGQFASQGFATSEPYTYEHDIPAWDKPMKYQLIADAGFDFYQQALGVRAGDLKTLTPCLTKLVPIMQQAIVDFIKNPAPVNALILKLVQQYNNGWIYSAGVADYAVTTMTKLGIIANDPKTGVLGEFDAARVKKLIGILTPIYSKGGKQIVTDLTPSDLVDNQFLDKSIKLP